MIMIYRFKGVMGMAEVLINIVTNVFVMWGVVYLIYNWWCDIMRHKMHLGIKLVVSFFVMTALYLWRVI